MAMNEYSLAMNSDNRIYFGTAAPTAGDFNKGDILFISSPSAGGAWCYVCTTASSAGNGGTWKSAGSLAG